MKRDVEKCTLDIIRDEIKKKFEKFDEKFSPKDSFTEQQMEILMPLWDLRDEILAFLDNHSPQTKHYDISPIQSGILKSDKTGGKNK